MEENQDLVLIQIAHELQNSGGDAKEHFHLSRLRKEYNYFVQEKAKCEEKRRFDPLYYLPSELWCECLLFAISDDPRTILIFTLVSSEWRDRIFGNPLFWADIGIDSREGSEDYLMLATQLSGTHPIRLTIEWPISEVLWAGVGKLTNRCTNLYLTYENVDEMDEMTQKMLFALEWPVLVHASCRLAPSTLTSSMRDLLRAPNLLSLEGRFMISLSEEDRAQNHPSLSGSGWIGHRVELTDNGFLGTYLRLHLGVENDRYNHQVTSLRIYGTKKLHRSDFDFPNLQDLTISTNAENAEEIFHLLNSSSRLSKLDIKFLAGDEPPPSFELLPALLPLPYLRELQLDLSFRDSVGDRKVTIDYRLLCEWLTDFLHALVIGEPLLSILSLSLDDGCLSDRCIRILTKILNNLTSLHVVSILVDTSIDSSSIHNGIIFLPRVHTLSLWQESILAHTIAPALVQLYLYSRRTIRDIEMPPTLCMPIKLALGWYRVVPIEPRGAFDHIQQISLYIPGFSKDREWPSKRLDDLCLLLLEKDVCPSLNTIGAPVYPSWDLLMRLIYTRSALNGDKNVRPIHTVKFPQLPSPSILAPLVTLLAGRLPSSPSFDVTILKDHSNIDK
jgi:hypothetical protein